MNRKDLDVLCRALRKAGNTMPGDDAFARYKAWRHTVKHIADAVQADNANFDRTKFLERCGIEGAL